MLTTQQLGSKFINDIQVKYPYPDALNIKVAIKVHNKRIFQPGTSIDDLHISHNASGMEANIQVLLIR